MERRLAAILCADMVGYSRLIERDEAGTLQRLQADRAQLIDPAIAQHGGEIIRLAGDGALLEFPSVVEAVQCAIDIQSGMADRNAARAADERIVFRMGVNVGEIVVEADNQHGEGINVAARLEGLAASGEILVTEVVAHYVEGKVSARLGYVGKRNVKNIERPLRVYRVLLDQASALPEAGRGNSMRRWLTTLSALAVVAIVAAIAPRLVIQQSAPQVGSGKPSLIVLPFRNLSGDAAQDYFVDGVTEDLITDLARLDQLFVISRNTAFAYQDRAVSARELTEELGVHYALEGSLRRQGPRIRVSAQLTDAATNRQIWGERYDRELTDVFAVQDELKQEIVSALSKQLGSTMDRAVTRQATRNLEAYELYLRALYARHQGELRSMRLAYWTLEKAIALEPDFPEALALLADVYALDYEGVTHPLDWERPPAVARSAAEAFARRAQALDPALAAPEIALAHLRLAELRFDEALPHAQRAVELEPGIPESHVVFARSLSALGRHQEALDAVAEAFRLDPKGTPRQYEARGMALIGLGNYAAAYETFKGLRAATIMLNWSPYPLWIGSGGLAGKPRAEMRADVPWFDVVCRKTSLAVPLFAQAKDQARLAEGMRLAGIPEYCGDHHTRTAKPVNITRIESLLVGRSTTLFCRWIERDPTLRISSDGQAVWNLRYDISEIGVARAETGQVCLQFPVMTRGRDFCFRIYPNDPPVPYSKNHSHVMDGPLLCFFTPEA